MFIKNLGWVSYPPSIEGSMSYYEFCEDAVSPDADQGCGCFQSVARGEEGDRSTASSKNAEYVQIKRVKGAQGSFWVRDKGYKEWIRQESLFLHRVLRWNLEERSHRSTRIACDSWIKHAALGSSDSLRKHQPAASSCGLVFSQPAMIEGLGRGAAAHSASRNP